MNFERRVEPQDLPEWMDEPGSYEDFRACLTDLEKVNALFLGYRPTLTWLEQFIGQRDVLRIVDVGCGGGDMLRQIHDWARAIKLPVTLTGIDLNPYAARAAVAFTCPNMGIEWLTGDAFSYTGEADIILSSLFTHHLPTEEVTRFLAWSEQTAALGWFVNDLVREPIPYYAFGVVAKLARWHRFVQHDGPVSFRRAFREADWQSMANAAGTGPITLQRWTPARLCVGRVK